MSIEAGDVVWNITGTKHELKQALTDSERMAKESYGRIAQIAGGALLGVGAAITGFSLLSIKAFAESEAAAGKLEAVLKSTGGAAGMTKESCEALATSLAKVTAYDDDMIKGGEAVLLTFTKIGKEVFPQATEAALNMSTFFKQDLQSSAIQLGKALNDPIQGVSALMRVGVSFTEQQKEQIKVLVDTGKAMDAQRIILKELETEFGGQARKELDGFEGQLRKLKQEFGELQEAMGEPLVGHLKELTKGMQGLNREAAEFVKAHPQVAEAFAIFGLTSTVLGSILTFAAPVASALTLFRIKALLAAQAAGPGAGLGGAALGAGATLGVLGAAIVGAFVGVPFVCTGLSELAHWILGTGDAAAEADAKTAQATSGISASWLGTVRTAIDATMLWAMSTQQGTAAVSASWLETARIAIDATLRWALSVQGSASAITGSYASILENGNLLWTEMHNGAQRVMEINEFGLVKSISMVGTAYQDTAGVAAEAMARIQKAMQDTTDLGNYFVNSLGQTLNQQLLATIQTEQAMVAASSDIASNYAAAAESRRRGGGGGGGGGGWGGYYQTGVLPGVEYGMGGGGVNWWGANMFGGVAPVGSSLYPWGDEWPAMPNLQDMAGQAKAWRRAAHPGWYAALDEKRLRDAGATPRPLPMPVPQPLPIMPRGGYEATPAMPSPAATTNVITVNVNVSGLTFREHADVEDFGNRLAQTIRTKLSARGYKI